MRMIVVAIVPLACILAGTFLWALPDAIESGDVLGLVLMLALLFGLITAYENTEFVVEVLPGMAGCLDCGAEFVADLENLVCPECGGKKLNPLSGRDLTLKEIEAI